MGRALQQHQARKKAQANRWGPGSYDRKWMNELKKEDKDLWKKAGEMGIWGGSNSKMSHWEAVSGKGNSKQKLWEQAAQMMGMGNLDDKDELKKLMHTYEKAGIKDFDSMNDLQDFKKTHDTDRFNKLYMERAGNDFQELFSAFAEQAGINTPEGGWKMPDSWAKKLKEQTGDLNKIGMGSQGRSPIPNDPRHDAAPNTFENRGVQPPSWAPEGADPWGRRGDAQGSPGYGPAWGGAGSYGGGGDGGMGWGNVPYAGHPSQTSGWASPYYTPSTADGAGFAGVWGSGSGAQMGSWNYAPQGAW